MTGSTPFSLDTSASNFGRSLKKLDKSLKHLNLGAIVGNCLEGLLVNPYPASSREEPLPKRTKLAQGWTFHKLELRVGKGASGQIRLMYLVNEEIAVIKPIWIYNHEQFTKRPSDQDIDGVIQETFDYL
jgi:hypothetical protein